MKKRTLLLLPFLLGACHSDENAIRQAAQGYLDAMGNYRIMEAAPFATQETVETTLQFIDRHIMPHAQTDSAFAANIKANTPATIQITSVTLTSDTTATITFEKETPIQRQQGQKELRLRHGQWLVHEIIQVPPMLQAATTPDSLRLRGRDTANLKLAASRPATPSH